MHSRRFRFVAPVALVALPLVAGCASSGQGRAEIVSGPHSLAPLVDDVTRPAGLRRPALATPAAFELSRDAFARLQEDEPIPLDLEATDATAEELPPEAQPIDPDQTPAAAVDRSKWIPVTGKHAIGFSSGWAIFEGDVQLTDLDGGLGFEEGQDDSSLDPVWGGALKYNYFFNENAALGAIVEVRRFDASLVQPLSSPISPEEYTSVHLLLSGRLYTDPLPFYDRMKLFGGIDLGYVPGIELEADVLYSPQYTQTIELNGDEFYTIGFVAGGSWWVGDLLGMDASVELGAFYETAIDETEDTITLQIPNGGGGLTPNRVAGEVVPQGVIFFLGTTLYL
ncbi:MAG: hypothetical protein AAFZ65_00430 [Planctomycetota bacterium]